MGKVYIPVNIRKRTEYVDGIGKEEVRYALVAGGLGVIVGICLFAIFKQFLFIIFMPIILSILTLGLTRKNPQNQSFIDTVKYYFDFNKMQKRYYFEYYNPYEKEVKDEKGSNRSKEKDGE